MVEVLGYLLVLAVIAGLLYTGLTGFHRVPDGRVGLVVKKFGGTRRRDDDPRVSFHGAAGPQARTLPANSVQWLPRWLYDVRYVERTEVPNGTIGLVIAKAGASQPVGAVLATHVECDDFTDGERFLREGGQRGRQQHVLRGGSYDINTDLFEVITVQTPEALDREGLTPQDLRQIAVPVGETGVVITHVGAPPNADQDTVGRVVGGHAKFQLPWVFLSGGGQQGVQGETLDEGGHYAINPWFAHVVLIPSRVLILEWSGERKDEHNLDAALDQVVLDVQGHTVRLDMKQTVQIPPDAAPRLIRRFGDVRAPAAHLAGRAPVRQFVEKELASFVAGYFRRISARYRIQEFITKYDEVGNELAAEVRQALARTGVVAVNTTLEEFTCDEPELNEMRRKIALQVEQVKIEKERLHHLEAQRASEAVLAEIEMQRVRVEEARKQLEYVELKILLDRLGPEHVAMERILHEWSQVNVPQVIAGADGDLAHAMLQAMPFTQARDMLMNMADAAKGLERSQERKAISEGDA
ncbi:SPFH domain-containing protein [Thermomonospora umbrina]|uniref:Putative membrane protein YqiK n=1 Tax=Thermomonospora umbrina TaxID=111806 RepID=A0A3D9SJX8_9ACTN|nr:SPFH domain-containing protein [Thermomonospora umbrina]REE96189.1 putative membrane protein YqiK [Thermomonospora umbrina]